MKKLIYLFIVIFSLSIVSCDEDYLERTPLDQISEPEFWKTASDLKLYSNWFYNKLPGWAGVGNGFSANPDNGTDVSLYTTVPDGLNGNNTVPTAASGTIWSWDEVRRANYFLANVSKAEGDEASINQYTGEGYFFRAYFYYELLNRYGALPIIDKYIDNTDTDYLYAARGPRNEVADFILADLDMAISLLKTKGDLSGEPRVSKEVAQLFKARVALFEGTWEKYHAGTEFGVSGSDGSAYLQQAADASKAVIDGGAFSLHADYGSIFNQTDLSGNKEVMLWRQYDYITYGRSYGNDSQYFPNRSGYTRFAVRSYLCKDGLPVSVSPLYKGDEMLDSLEINRDPRLAATVMVPGDIEIINSNGDTVFFSVPELSGNGMCPTAYETQKYRILNVDEELNNVSKDLAKISFRYAEALLIYAEAKAELGTVSQGDLDVSINKLRDRVGMPHLTMASITADPEWPDYGYTLTDVLYEIRRERSVELLGEGFRSDDLRRWRAHNLFVGKRPRGAFYEDILKNANNKLTSDEEGYLDPYQGAIPTGYGFNPSRDYLSALPSDELVLNENLTQNPGWE
ncbi:RagB/SusD family nutrient uptake outer membrane protein [uncultured Draconibacterium sp.]|uniref:RagB/SusD family nutrient uptake outer membrane protein n=1 Tax=uncultured Draconibacterium sp. TaxID=1573823 RepID=UPI0025FDB1C5|nr:RagB/SusD family nutrient uptake outer membrane protein [uncultured Draconibacterium sp.]